MALERALDGFDPEQHVGAGIVAPFTGERIGNVGGLPGVQHQLVQSIRQLRQLRRKLVQGAGQLARRDEMGAPVVGQGLQRLAGERQAVARAGDGAACIGGIAPPRGTGVGERDQVAGQVAAVDRRDIGGIQRTQIRRVIPIEEVATEALQGPHGRQRRLEALDGFERADPAEVAGGGRRQQQQAEIGRRRAVGDDGRGILLEVVRRQHVVGLGDERLEEPPGAPGDQPERSRIGRRKSPGCRHRPAPRSPSARSRGQTARRG